MYPGPPILTYRQLMQLIQMSFKPFSISALPSRPARTVTLRLQLTLLRMMTYLFTFQRRRESIFRYELPVNGLLFRL
jgi:hypothetical protein